MSAEILTVIILVAAAVEGVVWLEVKSRRNSRGGNQESGPWQ
jgi:hypothetical protein